MAHKDDEDQRNSKLERSPQNTIYRKYRPIYFKKTQEEYDYIDEICTKFETIINDSEKEFEQS